VNAKNHWQSAGGLTDGSLEIHKHPAKNTGKIIVLKFHSALAQNEFIKNSLLETKFRLIFFNSGGSSTVDTVVKRVQILTLF
jgi:hypothetical protein